MISTKMRFLLAITGVVIGGCSPQASQQTYLPVPAAAHVSSPATPVVQAAIDDVGRYGESIYDMAKVSDWKQAASHSLKAQFARHLQFDLLAIRSLPNTKSFPAE